MTATIAGVDSRPASDVAARPGAERRDRLRITLAIAVAACLVLVANRWGEGLIRAGLHMFVNAPPLTGRVLLRLTPLVIPVVLFAAFAIRFAPTLARTLTWHRLLLVATLAAAAWAVLLAGSEGARGVLRAPSSLRDYLVNVSDVGASPVSFLSTYVERIGSLAVKGRSHPPGMILLLWGMSRIGLGGPGWEAVLQVAVGASAVPAVLLAVREVAGETRARAAAPFVAIAPAAIWIATSGDALYAGVGAWAVAGLVLATGRRDRSGDLLAIAAGLLFGALLFLSYGLVLLWIVPAVVARLRRRLRPLLLASVGPIAFLAAFEAAGFWWPAGLAATAHQYAMGVASRRPYGYFVIADLAAFAIACGPASVAGLAVLRDRGLWSLAGGALVAVAAADLSGLSKGEVERIWLPFTVWILAAAGALPWRSHRAWLAVTVALTIVLQVGVLTPW